MSNERKLDINKLKDLLQKYQEGKSTPEESRLVEEWLAVTNKPLEFDEAFIDEQLDLIKNRIDTELNKSPKLNKPHTLRWLAIAASFLLITFSFVYFYSLHLREQSSDQSSLQARIEEHVTKGWVYVKTPKGLRDRIRLPDGSYIVLNASSILRYPVKFINHKRPVYLDEGEALFNVAKDKSSPFTVYTNKYATTALGTAFNIRSYSKEHKVSISLIHGKIRVDDLQASLKASTSRILFPRQQIILNKQSGQILKTNFKDESAITSWQNGVLYFKDATMDEVINSIENNFNVVIDNQSSHVNWSYAGSFKNESLADVLKIVCLTEGISYTREKNRIILK